MPTPQGGAECGGVGWARKWAVGGARPPPPTGIGTFRSSRIKEWPCSEVRTLALIDSVGSLIAHFLILTVTFL